MWNVCNRNRHGILIVACSIALFAGCKPKGVGSKDGGNANQSAPPSVEVKVTKAESQPLIDYREYTGRTLAVNSVEIRSRVSGYVLQSPPSEVAASRNRNQAEAMTSEEKSVSVNEGASVSQGTLLFQIDPQPYELALKQAKGNLAATEARLMQSQQDLSRSKDLLATNAISKAEYDQAFASNAEAIGQIENLKAITARAELDLKFTRVVSPIDGLLGRTLVTNGNLVVADNTILTTVVSDDPIYVDFDVDEQSLLDYRKRMLNGEVKSARDTAIPIRLALANEVDFLHHGVIDFVNNTTDPNSGNTRIRGSFDNKAGKLSPGLFARIQVPFTAQYDAVLIPTEAIGMDQQGRFVMIVADGKAERRPVSIGDIYGPNIVIRAGVQAGEIVITSGLQKIRQGLAVNTSFSDTAGSTKEP